MTPRQTLINAWIKCQECGEEYSRDAFVEMVGAMLPEEWEELKRAADKEYEHGNRSN